MTEGAKIHQARLNRLTIEEKQYLSRYVCDANKIIEGVAMQGETELAFLPTSTRSGCEDTFKLLLETARISRYSFKSNSDSSERDGKMTISFGAPEDCVFVFRILESNDI